MALGVSRSNVLTKKTRSTNWADLRKSPPKLDDADLKDAIACVVKDRATYGYRRVWARVKIDGRQGNHKRVYRVMRDEGWLLFRQGQKPLDTRKHEGTVAVKESDTRWCSDGLELSTAPWEVHCSIRHKYAKNELLVGTDIHTFPKQMATSVAILDRHNSELTAILAAGRLA